MTSVGTRGVTIVTIVTLVFGQTLHGNHWVRKLLGRSESKIAVTCKPHAPCPHHKLVVRKVVRKTAAKKVSVP